MSPEGLATRYREITARIRQAETSSGRAGVALIAVSKTQPVEAIEALYSLGHRDFGENYVQELVEKAGTLARRGCEGIRWHMIGHLQSNKARQVAPVVFAVHSVTSEKLALELDRRWQASGRSGRLPVFLEVNIDAEPSKEGLRPDEAPALAARVASLASLSVQGLMAIPDPARASDGSAFRRLRELEESCRPHTAGKLSMGMTSDFEVAIREGATHVRVGTALFGARARQ